MADAHDTDKNIEVWKIKKLIKALEAARGNGTSMISLIMPPRDQIARVTKMLGDEFGTASNIKSRVNRQSVLGAITSAQQRLKLYNKVPPNGLVLYTGTIVTDDGKEKKVTIDFEPFRPINASLYLCDNKFHTEALNELLESDDKFGFIVMDGNGTLFGTLSGNTREVLHKFSVDLPKKHGRGGQSALRFARLRMEKRHNYVRKTAELATQFYINPATSQPNVSGLILAGSADFKTELSQSDMFDPRLQAKILNVVDVSYGGENGFNQAIELSSEILSNVKFIQEKRLIGKYFEEISQDTGKYVFGVDDTLQALDAGAVETLIVWENLDMSRYVLKNSTTGEVVIKHFNKEQEANQSNFRDPESSADYEVQEKLSLLEWFANEYRRFGCTLEFVTNKSQEGSQFCRGFGGIGGILRYQLDMRTFDEFSDDGGEREAKMLAPVWEVAARAAAAAAPPPLPPRPSAVLLHEKFDCELSCLSPNELSAVSYNLTCSHIVQSLALQISATLLATTGENLSYPCTFRSIVIVLFLILVPRISLMLPKEDNLASMKGSLYAVLC
ncbi:eukaryotic peptide chain release factor subunit 1-3-like [Cicer arietinum]|uniref:eukaryotic peptide chain release factor subunit 1-3-like n=1 Tax=Cicer arietinum TaxID=3827 RepID=UPI003CC6174E